MDNVIRTGVPFDRPCPEAPDDGYEWFPVIFRDEWELVRGMKKMQPGPDEVAVYPLGEPPRVIRTRP